jgi:hypothetical protein
MKTQAQSSLFGLRTLASFLHDLGRIFLGLKEGLNTL